MNCIFADAALLDGGWVRDVRIGLAGRTVASVEAGVRPQAGDERHGFVLPGLGNLHSHAFQRGMAGLAETRGKVPDSFWSWRKVMYDFALSVTPEEMQAIASLAYVEMLETGFTRVGEFHYLHNDHTGRPYLQPAEMAQGIAAAAEEAGIALTLLPVFYAHAGFGGTEPAAPQRRFLHSVDGFERLMEICRQLMAGLPGMRLGIAPHSLRAVRPEELSAILPLAGAGPVHIHIAEQTREVEECLAWSGARPVQWLLDHAPVNANWTLVHATHMTADETAGVARSGAVAGLCPITEANLGDGTFPAPEFLEQGGALGIGSDSNVDISLPLELRQLEYSQRLHLRSRNVLAEPGGSTGQRLFSEALKGGARSLQGTGAIAVGADADFISLATTDCPHATVRTILDHWVFGKGVAVDCVWVAGRKLVEGGRHRQRQRVVSRFHSAMGAVLGRLS